MKVLVTGATGYIGGRLVPLLLEKGHSVRVLVRDPARLKDRPWTDRVEVVQGDVASSDSMAEAVRGMDAAYYLVHSMCSGPDFALRDRRAAEGFAEAAQGIGQVIYLGGILPEAEGGRGSKHLRSRAEVGEILRAHLPTTEVRAGPIIGSGSASFEMVRYLTERLPVMVAPKWIENRQPPTKGSRSSNQRSKQASCLKEMFVVGISCASNGIVNTLSPRRLIDWIGKR